MVLVNKASSAVRNAAHDLARGDKSDLRDKAVKPITNNVSVLIMGVDESDVRGKEYGEAITRFYLQHLIKIAKLLNY